ncbi:MAG: hypothetical protein ABSD39_15645, partial [Terriglobales bacterium]
IRAVSRNPKRPATILIRMSLVVLHVVMVVMPVATPPDFVQLRAPLFGLPAVFAMFRHSIAQPVLSLVNIPVALVVCPRWQRRTHQADNR